MTDLKKYHCILWDWNGTLLDDPWLCVDVMNGMLKERNLPLRTIDQYREIFDFPVKDYYVTLGFDFDKEPFEEVGLEFIVRYNQRKKEISLHPEAKEVLKEFRDHGFRQFILSAREQQELTQETRDLGVFDFFKGIYGLDDHYANGKTGVGIRLLKETGINPGEVIYVGDTRHDAEVAGEIGVDCILISNGHHTEERLLQCGVPVIGTLKELESLLLA
ncbi:MAG TPA: HAD family hydrolase [Bacteroidales bacterium]|nr:HAD family hydrolase [Bacteroidales bacterium]HPS74049.1 HAD family hydrolase [Bacteroidales bacterium]